MSETAVFSDIKLALDDLRQGRMVILVDDEGRENEGDLIVAAECVTAETINFMCQYARGLVCLPMLADDFDRLNIPMMATHNRSPLRTAFGVSFEAARGVTTGISAQDRAQTILTAIDASSGPDDITMPGHIFPLKAHPHGVLARAGHTEGSVDLARLAGFKAAAVICEVMNPDGSMARLPDLQQFADTHHIRLMSIADLIRYRIQHEPCVQLGAIAELPTEEWGDFQVHTFEQMLPGDESIALVKQPLDRQKPCLVRLHSECLTGDVFGSSRCDCGSQLSMALSSIAEQGGALLYLRQEGRGIGLINKLKAYTLQDQGLDTVEANHQLGFVADQRDYSVAAQMLNALKINKIRLLTNNPHKVSSLQQYGVTVTERVSLQTQPTVTNRDYLRTKRDKLGHLLTDVGGD